MEPFNYLEDAEIWMDKNASGPISVLVKNPPLWADINDKPSRWELEWELDSGYRCTNILTK